jgi:hypothetical protein
MQIADLRPASDFDVRGNVALSMDEVQASNPRFVISILGQVLRNGIFGNWESAEATFRKPDLSGLGKALEGTATDLSVSKEV